jgi:hypothetical protein
VELGWYFVGLDLGQAKDLTTVAALERSEVAGEWVAKITRSAEMAGRCGLVL